MKRLIIIGAGGHGRVVADIAENTKRFDEISFLDDSNIKVSGKYSVIGKIENYVNYISDCYFIVALGNAELREKIQTDIMLKGARLTTLIHPSATVGADVFIGDGSVVMAGAVINPNAKIGNGVIVNTCSSIDHDCIIGDFSHISVGAHIAGTVSVGNACMIGAGATVINNINICDDCTVGAGATVIKDITQSGTYIGTPATVLK